ncbi:glycosyltransferase family 39 protein [Streptomyces rhizoryzae]|uniref:glycosyltransferase family 39 protein n=1 Tax=Streptomyces rhizoryzae TaxID=2932493 RepID=UPI00249EF4A1|nr:glycosyltransferase family 39 protein [Streptomyces rhizoryzae]
MASTTSGTEATGVAGASAVPGGPPAGTGPGTGEGASAGAGRGGGRPRWVRVGWPVVLAGAAVLFAWDIQHSGLHAFYAETARSMAESWRGFLFGSFDPGNSITIDKLPGFLWPQALAIRIFGFHAWALTLPQVIEGVLSVVVLRRAVRRWAGESAALLAAAAFALTPAIAGLFRTQVEDPAFTLLVLLAADATLRAARRARLRPLLAAGAWVGLGFQAKMLEAWAVLPALGLLYVLAAPTTRRRRLAHLGAAGALCLAVSASWVLLVTFTPPHDRPYIDGTTNNSAVSQVVGYNFLNRFSGLGISAADTGSVPVSTMAGTAPGPPTGHSGSGVAQWAKMFGPSLVSQVGWLYPAAALAAVCGPLWRRGRPRTDPLRAGFVLWGVWLATYFLVFSAGAVGGHTYYMGVVAVPLAALFGAGTVQFWRAWLSGARARAWALPTVVAGTVVWSVGIGRLFPAFLPWLAPAALGCGAAALALLAGARVRAGGGRTAASGGPSAAAGLPARTRVPSSEHGAGRRRPAVFGLAAGLVAMLLPSAAWASSVLDPVYGHSGMGATGPVAIRHRAVRHAADDTAPHRRQPRPGGPDPGAAHHRPTDQPNHPPPRQPSRQAPGERSRPRTGALPPAPGEDALTPRQQQLLAYVRAHREGAVYLFATTSWRTASPYILHAGAPVLPMGGFTGTAPTPSPAAFRHLVATGRLRYVVLGGPATTPGRALAPWVRAHCARVPGQGYDLYRCSAEAAVER